MALSVFVMEPRLERARSTVEISFSTAHSPQKYDVQQKRDVQVVGGSAATAEAAELKTALRPFVALPEHLRINIGNDCVPLSGPTLVRASGDWSTRFHRHCDHCPALALSARIFIAQRYP